MSNVALSWWSLFSPSRLVKWITWTRFKPRFVCSKADKHKFFLKLWDLNSNFTLTLGYLEPALNNPPWCNKIILHFWDSSSICKANRSTRADEALVKLKMVVYFGIRELISCLCQNLLNQQLVTKDTFVLHWAPGLDNYITFVVNMNGLGGSATMIIIFYRSNMKGGGGLGVSFLGWLAVLTALTSRFRHHMKTKTVFSIVKGSIPWMCKQFAITKLGKILKIHS